MSTTDYRGDIIKAESQEEILKDNPGRWVLLPIEYPTIWDLFKKHEMSFWTAEEIDYGPDTKEIGTLDGQTSRAIKRIIAFNAICNGSVYECLAVRTSSLLVEVSVAEARSFYGFQIAMEMIHREAFCHLLETYVPKTSDASALMEEVLAMEEVQGKKKWYDEHASRSIPFGERLIISAIVTKVFSAVSRLVIASLKQGSLPACVMVDKLVSRDQMIDAEFSFVLYGTLKKRIPEKVATDLVHSAVAIEKKFASIFVKDSILAQERADEYLDYVGQKLLAGFGYKVTIPRNPAPELEHTSNLHGKTSNGDAPVTRTAQPLATSQGPTDPASNAFSTEEDF